MLLFLLSSNPLLFTSFQGGFELLFLRVQVDQILCLWYRAVKNKITQKWKKSSTFFNFKLVQELEFPNHFKELSDPLIWQRNFNPPHVGGGASPSIRNCSGSIHRTRSMGRHNPVLTPNL